MKRTFLLAFLFLLILTTALLFFFMKNREKERPYNASADLRKIKDVGLLLIGKIKLDDAAYRIMPSEDSVLICYDTFLLKASSDLSFKRQVILSDGLNAGLHYYVDTKNIIAGLNAKYSTIFYSDGKNNFSDKPSGFLLNTILMGDTFYLNNLDLGKEVQTKFEKMDVISRKVSLSVDLKKLMAAEIKHCKECYENTLEGNFFRISDTSFGFYFYRGPFILIYRNGHYAIQKTIIKAPFKPFTKVETEYMGMKAFPCQTKDDSYAQLSVCSKAGKIFILSNVVDRNQKRTVDVYDVKGMRYLSSFYLDKYENELPEFILLAEDQRLIVSYSGGSVMSYQINTSVL